jgi:energy-coupling factor transport system ATP-binding protein
LETYKIDNLTFTYPERERPALDGVSLTVEQGALVALCGPSGCGKTTLLRQLKPIFAPHGVKSGSIFFEGTDVATLDQRAQSTKIGFVMQSPDNQLVTDKVWHELAFGLESLGLDNAAIRLRVAEMASFFGIQTWFHKSVTELSGGQKQLLNLASIMAMQPSVLILDEPTSQLDPIAASEFLATIGKINRELGVTVILTEHRLEEVFPLCTSAVVMDKGGILLDGTPREVGLRLREQGRGMFLAMPTAMRIWSAVEPGAFDIAEVPVTVRDGRRWLAQLTIEDAGKRIAQPLVEEDFSIAPRVELRGVWFKYEKELPDVVKGLSYSAYPGQLSAILGGNGTGKTTTLSLMAGLLKAYRGTVRIGGSIGVLPQNPQALFVKKTVREDLLEILSDRKIPRDEQRARLARMAALCRLDGLLEAHPYDLSGGEQQRAALAKVLLLQPEILLLDEPTKGLDAEFKLAFAGILKKLTAAGVAVVMVSHDIEFCAEHADRCALFFDGGIVSEGAPREFFSGNSFYTSSANRMARAVFPLAVTADDVILALGGKTELTVDGGQGTTGDAGYMIAESSVGGDVRIAPKQIAKLSVKRKIAAGLFSLGLLLALVLAGANFAGLRGFISGGDTAVSAAANAADAWRYAGIMLAIIVAAVGLVVAVTWGRGGRGDVGVAPYAGRRRLSKRTMLAAAMILVAIPVTIYVGTFFFGDRRYYFISLLIILETMLPFAFIFERRKPQARELVVIAVLCGLAVAGRGAFFMLPQFKPVAAMVIIAGVAFGGEAGFLVGAMTGFVSNMFFGQGPWTPWQMFAFGLIGFLAGVLFRKGWLRRSRGALCVFGGLATLLIYGGLMNPAQVLMYQASPTRAMFLAAYLQGLPFDLLHAAATVTFLLLISRPMLEKLDRIKVKYGLVE